MEKKQCLCISVLFMSVSFAFVQEVKAVDPLSMLVVAKATGSVAKYLIPVGALGYVMWHKTKIALLDRQLRKNGEGIVANGKKLDQLQCHVDELTRGQKGIRTQLSGFTQEWREGQKKLESGQANIQSSLGDLESNITEVMSRLKQDHQVKHEKICSDLHMLQRQLAHSQKQQEEILRVLAVKEHSYFLPFTQPSLKNSLHLRNT